MKKQHLQALIAILVTLLLPIFFLKRSYMIESRTRHISSDVQTPHASLRSARNKAFVIIIPITEGTENLSDQVHSIYAQNYANYRIVYLISDALSQSPDVQHLLEDYGHRSNCSVNLIKNEQNMLTCYENVVRESKDNEVIIHLDVQDVLAANNVLEQLNHVYCTEDIWLAYSQPIETEKGDRNKPWSVKKSQQRNWIRAPMKTYYAYVFKQVSRDESVTQPQDSFEETLQDLMQPMAEFSQKHIRYVPDVLTSHRHL